MELRGTKLYKPICRDLVLVLDKCSQSQEKLHLVVLQENLVNVSNDYLDIPTKRIARILRNFNFSLERDKKGFYVVRDSVLLSKWNKFFMGGSNEPVYYST